MNILCFLNIGVVSVVIFDFHQLFVLFMCGIEIDLLLLFFMNFVFK